MLLHELILCNPSSHGRKSASKQLHYEETKEMITQPDDDEDSDSVDDGKFELLKGENWLRITKAASMSVLYTQEEDDKTQEQKSLSQQTTQDPPRYYSMSQTPPPADKFVASILSSESLDLNSNNAQENCFICFDVTLDGNYVAVKDMRWSNEGDETSSVGIWRSDEQEWSRLPRRQLCLLQIGDKISTCLEHRDTTALTLEYQTRDVTGLQTQPSQSQQQVFYSQQSQVFQTQTSQQQEFQTQESQDTEMEDEHKDSAANNKDHILSSQEHEQHEQNIHVGNDKSQQMEVNLTQESPGRKRLSQDRLELLLRKDNNEGHLNHGDHSSLTSNDSDKTEPMSQMPPTDDAGGLADLAKPGIMETQEKMKSIKDDDTVEPAAAEDVNDSVASNGDENDYSNKLQPERDNNFKSTPSNATTHANDGYDSDATEDPEDMATAGATATKPNQTTNASINIVVDKNVATATTLTIDEAIRTTLKETAAKSHADAEVDSQKEVETKANYCENFEEWKTAKTKEDGAPANSKVTDAVDSLPSSPKTNETTAPMTVIKNANFSTNLAENTDNIEKLGGQALEMGFSLPTQSVDLNLEGAKGSSRPLKEVDDGDSQPDNGTNPTSQNWNSEAEKEEAAVQGEVMEETASQSAKLSSQKTKGSANVSSQSGSWQNSLAEQFSQSLKRELREKEQASQNAKKRILAETGDMAKTDIDGKADKQSDEQHGARQKEGTAPSSTKNGDRVSSARKRQRKASQTATTSNASSPNPSNSSTRRGKRKASSPQETSEMPLSARKSLRTKSTPPKSDADSNDDSKLAKKRYTSRCQTAIDSGVVMVASSNLSTSDAAILESLISKKTLSGGAKLKLSEDVDSNTTLCVIPSNGNKKPKGTIASIRSKKVLRSTLLGIPIVTPDWLKDCKKHGKLVRPEAFIQTIPTKVKELESNKEHNNGVLKLASAWARHPEQPELPFQNMSVYLCGNFKLSRDELTYLLTKGAATMLHTPLATSNQLKYLSKAPAYERSMSIVVIVCGNTRVTVNKSLEKDIKMAVEEISPPVNLMVVDELWVIETITCAKALPANLFQPSARKDLWNICMSGQ